MENFYCDEELHDSDHQGPPRPKCRDCKQEIICSQARVSECESRLFCEVVYKLSCEIQHARCIHELERLIAMTNEFLVASSKKEMVIAKFVPHHHTREIELND